MPGTLIFHHNGIGDYVMSVPAMRALAHFAPPPVHIVCGAVDASLLYEDTGADRIVRTATSGGHFAHRFDPDSPTDITPPYEWFISLAHWFSADILQLRERCRARSSAGLFPHFDLRPQFEHTQQAVHEIDRIFAVAAAFNYTTSPDEWTYALPLPSRSMAFATALAATLPVGNVLLAVHAETRPEKIWPLDRLDAALTTVMEKRPDVSPVILNTPPEQLPRTARNPAALFAGRPPVADAMAVTAICDCFLGIDSCMLHVADLYQRPGVALFGPTDPAQYGYRLAPRVRAIHVRPTDRNLRRLEPDAVVHALTGVLDDL